MSALGGKFGGKTFLTTKKGERDGENIQFLHMSDEG